MNDIHSKTQREINENIMSYAPQSAKNTNFNTSRIKSSKV